VFLVCLIGTTVVSRVRTERARRGATRLSPAQVSDLFD
jgi:hypothetical protein